LQQQARWLHPHMCCSCVYAADMKSAASTPLSCRCCCLLRSWRVSC
jgi:hypothetical protein